MKKILICGLPGTGKTTLAGELRKQLQLIGKTAAWFNADDIRNTYSDWNFSPEGRIRQAKRMRDLSNGMMTDYVICDFVAPTEEIRNIFGADYTIFMDTEESSAYKDTDNIFERPNADYTLTVKEAVKMTPYIIKHLMKHILLP
jgi:adenylylsulfate kinase